MQPSVSPMAPPAIDTLDPNNLRTFDELDALSYDDQVELWGACPHPSLYEQAFDAYVEDLATQDSPDAPITDVERLATLHDSIRRATLPRPEFPGLLRHGALLWIELPSRVRKALEGGEPMREEPLASRPVQKLAKPILIIAGVAVFGCILSTIVNKAVIQPAVKSAAATATALAQAPQGTATVTPLALDNLDQPLGQGDNLRNRYPVTVQLSHPDSPDLVFPVQQKEVAIADWKYARETDVASAVLGLAVRPVIGIPYSEASAAYLNALQPGDTLKLSMNTGQTLQFSVTLRQRVPRQDTSPFDQHTPGLVLLLLADPAPDRLMIASIPLDIPDDSAPSVQSVPSGHTQALPTTGLSVTVTGARLSPGSADAPLPADWAYALVDVTLASGDAPVALDPANFELVDTGSGARYSPARLAPSLTSQPTLTTQTLAAHATLQATIGYLVPQTLDTPRLAVHPSPGAAPTAFELPVTHTTSSSPADLQVALLKVETTRAAAVGKPRELVVTARLYNPTLATITLDAQTLSVVFTPALAGPDVGDPVGQPNGSKQFPIGAASGPSAPALPITIAPGQSQDVELHFLYAGDSYAGLTIGGYQYILTLAQATTP